MLIVYARMMPKTSVSGAKLLVYAEQEEALKQQLRCTQEVLEAAREQEEEAAAEKVALEQVSYRCYIPTHMLHICAIHMSSYYNICDVCVLIQLHVCARAAAAVRARRGRAVTC